jgi:putative transposase
MENLVLNKVLEIRKNHPRIGTRKLYFMMQPFLIEHHIKMGRDALFTLLNREKLLIKSRQRKVNTTYSGHWMRKWPNLIKNYRVTAPNQLWVSDITYWRVNGVFMYISFITDAYSHKIVGYSLSENLDMQSARNALLMAINTLKQDHKGLIHHSDRGTQYCAMDYIKILHKHYVQISMTESGDPKDNAIAERLNGIIKEEYLKRYKPKSFNQALLLLDKSVRLYNAERPHLSINLLTPNYIHLNKTKTYRKWKNYFKTNPVNSIQD